MTADQLARARQIKANVDALDQSALNCSDCWSRLDTDAAILLDEIVQGIDAAQQAEASAQ